MAKAIYNYVVANQNVNNLVLFSYGLSLFDYYRSGSRGESQASSKHLSKRSTLRVFLDSLFGVAGMFKKLVGWKIVLC